MDYKLNDCPFCGGKAEIKYVPNGWSYENMAYVKCAKCGASSKHLDSTCREEEPVNKIVNMFPRHNVLADLYTFIKLFVL